VPPGRWSGIIWDQLTKRPNVINCGPALKAGDFQWLLAETVRGITLPMHGFGRRENEIARVHPRP